MSNDRQEKSDDAGLHVVTAEIGRLFRKNQKLLSRFIEAPQQTIAGILDPLNVVGSIAAGTRQLASNPGRLLKANLELWQQHMQLWQNATLTMLGQDTTPVAEPERGDRRFKSSEWEESQFFDFLRQSYLITSRWLNGTIAGIEGLSEEDARKIQFQTEQLTNALSPSNFPLTNPQVIKETIESRGENLLRGMRNFKRDLVAGGGSLRITMADTEAFKLGHNVATTPGKIIFQNELMQLIQYAPSTRKVYRRPLLIAPPWINKYYILDLQPENSFIRWAVKRGYTVFVISWVNPDSSLADKTMDDYLTDGILAAIDAVEEATGERELSMIGYCIGGTLTGAALAWMAARKDNRVKAATFFAAQMDFSEAGDLKVFIDEKQLERLDEKMAEKGYLEGASMYSSFNLLRSNDLIWSFFVNNYLLGKEPAKFDLLYWNGDTTRMPRALHMFYLRQMYLHNNLAKPGGITLAGTAIDLGKVKIPIYLQAAKEDHIAPYNSVFKAKNLFSGPVRFLLAGSGHIAGVINAPAANKYNYWMNEDQPDDLNEWIEGAESHPGSWWEDWDEWIAPLSGAKVTARKPGSGALPVIEEAPGTYATKRS